MFAGSRVTVRRSVLAAWPGVPPGEHKVLIELVDADHKVFPGQAKTVKLTVPGTASHSH